MTQRLSRRSRPWRLQASLAAVKALLLTLQLGAGLQRMRQVDPALAGPAVHMLLMLKKQGMVEYNEYGEDMLWAKRQQMENYRNQQGLAKR